MAYPQVLWRLHNRSLHAGNRVDAGRYGAVLWTRIIGRSGRRLMARQTACGCGKSGRQSVIAFLPVMAFRACAAFVRRFHPIRCFQSAFEGLRMTVHARITAGLCTIFFRPRTQVPDMRKRDGIHAVQVDHDIGRRHVAGRALLYRRRRPLRTRPFGPAVVAGAACLALIDFMHRNRHCFGRGIQMALTAGVSCAPGAVGPMAEQCRPLTCRTTEKYYDTTILLRRTAIPLQKKNNRKHRAHPSAKYLCAFHSCGIQGLMAHRKCAARSEPFTVVRGALAAQTAR
jgi:hypothetical protein